MSAQVRILLIAAILALATGWLGLRRGNLALERRLASATASAAEGGP